MTTKTPDDAQPDPRQVLEDRLTALFHELQLAAAQPLRRGTRRPSGRRGVEAINKDIAALERELGRQS